MKLLQNRIENHIEEINLKKENTNKNSNDFCIINLTFDTNSFNRKCRSIGDFMKKLKNGKISYSDEYYFGRPKQNNREYFNMIIDDGGFYRYTYGKKTIELDILFNLKGDVDFNIDGEIIKSRISKIITPKDIKITFNDRLLLKKSFLDLSIIDIGWSVFGGELRNRLLY